MLSLIRGRISDWGQPRQHISPWAHWTRLPLPACQTESLVFFPAHPGIFISSVDLLDPLSTGPTLFPLLFLAFLFSWFATSGLRWLVSLWPSCCSCLEVIVHSYLL